MWKYEGLNRFSILNFFEFVFLNFHSNGADKRSSLFSLAFPKVSEWYFNYKKNYVEEKKLISWSRDSSKTWP